MEFIYCILIGCFFVCCYASYKAGVRDIIKKFDKAVLSVEIKITNEDIDRGIKYDEKGNVIYIKDFRK